MVKNTMKLYRRLFLHKTNKNAKETKGNMIFTFVGMTSLPLNSEVLASGLLSEL